MSVFVAPTLGENVGGIYDVIFQAVPGATIHRLEVSLDGGGSWTLLDGNITTVPDGSGNITWPWDTTGLDGIVGAQLRAQGNDLDYESAVLSDVPYAYYRLGEDPTAGGSQATDISGNLLHGQYMIHDVGAPPSSGIRGHAPLIVDDPDTCAYFNANPVNKEWAWLHRMPLLGNRSTTTFEAWFQLDTLAPAAGVSLLAAMDNGTGPMFIHQINGDGSVRARIWSLAGVESVVTTAADLVAINTKYHLVVKLEASTIRIFLNGAEVASGAGPATMRASGTVAANSGVGIGCYPNLGDGVGGVLPDWSYEGYVDELAFYLTALADSEIDEHYWIGTTAFSPPFYSELFNILQPPPPEPGTEPGSELIPATIESYPLLAELRLGPLQTPVDYSMAHNEEQDKINELVRAVNEVNDRIRDEIGLVGTAPDYSVTGSVTKRDLVVASATVNDLAKVVATLIRDLQARGVLE